MAKGWNWEPRAESRCTGRANGEWMELGAARGVAVYGKGEGMELGAASGVAVYGKGEWGWPGLEI